MRFNCRLIEVIVGSDVLYVTADGKHVFQGSIYNIDGGITDITENSRSKLRKALMEGITDEQTISFGKADLEDNVTVFTDIDCPYCVKLHNEMDQYNAAGIRVRYLFFPRAGLRSPGYAKAVSVWCSDDRETALTLGANPYQMALIVLKEAKYGIFAAVIAAFGRVIAEIGISMMLGGNAKGFTRTMTTAMALEYDKGEFVLAVALGITLMNQVVFRRKEDYEPHKGDCFSCGRCMDYCPVEKSGVRTT